MTYIIDETPQLDLQVQDYTICSNESVILGVLNEEPLDLVWQNSPSLSCTNCPQPVARPEVTTTYYLSSIGCGGKVIQDSLTVFVEPLPRLQEIPDIVLQRGDKKEVTANTLHPVNQINWFIDQSIFCAACESITVAFENTTQVRVEAITEAGCSEFVDFTVFVEDPCGIDKIEFANALTPNNDGFNDFFEIKNNGDAQINQIMVFTRWGEKIFESRDINQRWDGKIYGKDANPGVYLYLVRGLCKNGLDEFNVTGNITLLK